MEYDCIVFNQRSNQEAPTFCIFQAPVGEVINWSTIPHLSPENQDGIQRARNDTKVRAIKKFFLGDNKNTIPTAIVITLPEDAFSLNGNEIRINAEKKGEIFVVDGQHRLYGLNEFDPLGRVPLVAILNASNEERAFQFVVINNKVSKVAADHIRALTLKFTKNEDTPGLDTRLKCARLSMSQNLSYVGLANDSDDSPFYGIVSMPHIAEDNKIVAPAAIEASIAYIQSKNIRELSSDESAYDFFICIWNEIKKSWPHAFPSSKNLVSKVGIMSLTRFIVDAINVISGYPGSQIDLTNSESISNAVSNVLVTQSEEFWLREWTLSVSDSKGVRDQIQDALLTIHQNLRGGLAWHTDINFIKFDD